MEAEGWGDPCACGEHESSEVPPWNTMKEQLMCFLISGYPKCEYTFPMSYVWMSNRDWPCKTKKVTMWIHSTLLLPILYHRKVWVLGWSEVEIEDGSTASRWTKNCCHYILYQVLKNRPQAHFVLSKTPERYVCVVHSTHTYRSIVHAVYITCTTHNTRCACDLCSVYIISHDVPLPTLDYLGPYWFQQPVLLCSIPLSISGTRCVMDEETQTQGYNKRYK